MRCPACDKIMNLIESTEETVIDGAWNSKDILIIKTYKCPKCGKTIKRKYWK